MGEVDHCIHSTGGEMCTWWSSCWGVIPPFCYSWNNLSPAGSLFLVVRVHTWPCTREKWRCEVCGCCPAPPREGKLYATQQTKNSWLTFFFFLVLSCWALQMCRFKMSFWLCFWAVRIAQRQSFVGGVLFPKWRVPFVRRGEVMSVVEFRLPQDDSLNFWRAIYYLLWMKLQCV